MFSSLYAEVLKSARRIGEWVIQFVLVWLILIFIFEQGEEHSEKWGQNPQTQQSRAQILNASSKTTK